VTPRLQQCHSQLLLWVAQVMLRALLVASCCRCCHACCLLLPVVRLLPFKFLCHPLLLLHQLLPLRLPLHLPFQLPMLLPLLLLLLEEEVCGCPEGACHQPGRRGAHLPGSCTPQGATPLGEVLLLLLVVVGLLPLEADCRIHLGSQP
jgi:hypothetical protein